MKVKFHLHDQNGATNHVWEFEGSCFQNLLPQIREVFRNRLVTEREKVFIEGERNEQERMDEVLKYLIAFFPESIVSISFQIYEV